jgi:hypothetical protein
VEKRDEIEKAEQGIPPGLLIKSIVTLGGVVLLGVLVVTKFDSAFSFSISQWAALALLFIGGTLCAIKLDEKLLSRLVGNAKISENLSIGFCTLVAALILYLFWDLL